MYSWFLQCVEPSGNIEAISTLHQLKQSRSLNWWKEVRLMNLALLSCYPQRHMYIVQFLFSVKVSGLEGWQCLYAHSPLRIAYCHGNIITFVFVMLTWLVCWSIKSSSHCLFFPVLLRQTFKELEPVMNQLHEDLHHLEEAAVVSCTSQ